MNDEHIKQAARVIGKYMSLWDTSGRPDVDGGVDVALAQALEEAGLLAPSPLRVVYSEGIDHPELGWLSAWGRAFADPERIRERLGGNRGAIIRQHMTEWELYETVNRTE